MYFQFLLLGLVDTILFFQRSLFIFHLPFGGFFERENTRVITIAGTIPLVGILCQEGIFSSLRFSAPVSLDCAGLSINICW